MCGNGSNSTQQTQTSTTSANPQAMAAYQNLVGRAETVSNTPWNPGTQQQVANFTPDQMQAFDNVRGGIARPYVDAAAYHAITGAGPAAGGISTYMNPWTDQVVDTTQRDFDVQNQRQLSGVTGSARMAGSWGGDREEVAKSLAAEQQNRVQSPILANLRAQGFNTALGASQNDLARSLQGAGIMGQLAPTAFLDTQALLGTGGQQQTLDQARLDAQSGNAAAQSAYPFQTAQWLASILGSATPNMGSTTTSIGSKQGPTPNTWSQALGLGIAAAPYLPGAVKGLTSAATAMPALMAALNTGGRVPAYASGGGIGYVPQFQTPAPATGASRGGIQPHQQMSFGSDQPQKGLADHFKEIQDTAKGYQQGFKGIADGANNFGQWLNSSTTPGGWTTTVDYGSPGANLWAGIGNAMGFAEGGAINYGIPLREEDRIRPQGAEPVRVAPAVNPLPLGVDSNDPAGLYDAQVATPSNAPFQGAHYPQGIQQAGQAIAVRGGAPLANPPTEATALVDARGVPPSAGTPYGPPPADPMPIMGEVGSANGLNPTGGIGVLSPPRPSGGAPASGGIGQRFWNWLGSEDARQTLGPMGLAMMAASAQGGPGTTGVHFGIGGLRGLESQAAYREGERKAAIERGKTELAQRAAAIQDAQEGRAAAMHPYDIRAKQAEAAHREAQAAAGRFQPVDRDKAILDVRTGRILPEPSGGTNRFERRWVETEAPKRFTELSTASREIADTLSTIEDMRAIAPHASTGFGADWVLNARKLGERMGLDVGRDRIAPTELLQALSQKFAIAAAAPLKPVSNTDLQFLQRSFATIATSPETLKELLPQMESAARRIEYQATQEMRQINEGKVPDTRAIIDDSYRRYPSATVARYGAGQPPTGQAGAPGPTASTSASRAAPAPTDPAVAADIQRRIQSLPDGALFVLRGVPHVKQGTAVVPAPPERVARGLFGSISDRNDWSSSVPTFP